MLTYDQLKSRALSYGVPMAGVAKSVGYTPQGLKKSIEQETLPAKCAPEICKALHLTYGQFFGETILSEVPATTKDVVRLQNQLAAKDELIARLIRMLDEERKRTKSGQ